MPSDLKLPTKPCHNCKKRRWKCDRSLPVCQKCIHAGSECLGYGKLLIWNQGVARRGKMMGKSYEDLAVTKKESHGQASPPRARSTRNSDHLGTSSSSSESSHGSPPELLDREEADATIERTLIDPLVQDLNAQSRYYLYHFATQLCVDMVVYDGPGQNPIRDIIPHTSQSPVLLQVILANAAFHIHNIAGVSLRPSVYQPDRQPDLTSYYASVSRFGGPFTTSYHDALVAKQAALSLMAQSVTSVDNSNIDIILVSILLFVNYELIESGKEGKWRVHMDGAQKLINMLGTATFYQEPMSRLRRCVLSDFLVFFVLGMTLNFSANCGKLLPNSIDYEPILKYAETNNYLSCPAPLLSIMLQSFDLPDAREVTAGEARIVIQEQVKALLQQALAFNPTDWALTLELASPLENLEKRIRIASAHRAAVCIYIARVLPSSNPLIDPTSGNAIISLTGLADEVVEHVSQLRPGDQVFKSICWPLFLAGAESMKPAQRVQILKFLDALWSEMYWGYIRTVQSVLEIIWKFSDKAVADKDTDICWVDEVKRMGTDMLIA
ncbi:fungal-specific transcription factor domain-containing protein [Lophiotrema nucula]|uniref:Fungal-specific transcription factor domain-containing protein n=1 Tax=Lophiotrema nucula TaxID=690887 RepID=A0A6A5ZSJ2_9PLEO|nr:fungal-specific transcription factor domain-containing protein [Lophiotrema nucula]